MNRKTLQQTSKIQTTIKKYSKALYSFKLSKSKKINQGGDKLIDSDKSPNLKQESNNLNDSLKMRLKY